MAKIFKILDKETGETKLPVSIFDAILSNDGSKTLTQVLAEIEVGSGGNVSVSYILETVENGCHFVDAQGNIGMLLSNSGLNAFSLYPDLYQMILTYVRDNYLDEALAEVQSIGFGDGVNIGDLDEGDVSHDFYIEVFDSQTLSNKKIPLRQYVSNVSGSATSITKVQTWGDSITAAGKYQISLASTLGLQSTAVKNAGLASDYSMHVRRRFVSYFTDETAYKGNASYSVPTLAERMNELQTSFFVFWIGTNNLINPSGRTAQYTTDSSAYMALQANPDFRYDALYASSYVSQMLEDLRLMLAILPHQQFAIIGGHGGFTSDTVMRNKMIQLDDFVGRMYPRNFINLRELMLMAYDFKNINVTASFVKPAINSSVAINVNNASGLTTNKYICVGTKEIYDKYQITSVSGNTLTCKLVESNTAFASGDTIISSYNLVSDLGRDQVSMPTRVYLYDDCVAFNLLSFPISATDPIHFTDAGYTLIGTLIGKELLKIAR